MSTDELIGSVVASYLRDHLSSEDGAGVARYLLDCLTADQTAAVARTILADTSLSQLIEIKLPIRFVGNHGLPAEVLTDQRTTYFRNAACDKSALLVANIGDDEEQSLKDLVSIGAPELLAQPELWITIAAGGLPILDQHKQWWLKAIQALLEVKQFALDRFAEYVLQTRQAVEDGHPILLVGSSAVGESDICANTLGQKQYATSATSTKPKATTLEARQPSARGNATSFLHPRT